MIFGLFEERFSTDSLSLSLSLQYQLRSIGILGIAIATILHLRLSISGPVTQFSTADNPTAKANTILTRLYTFLYLPVFNFKLLVYPHTLSFDWGMDAIPRITSLFDARNFISLLFYGALCRMVVKCCLVLRRGASPKVISNKRIGRTIHKRKHQTHNGSPKADDMSNQLWDSENCCSVCKQGLKWRHASACRGSVGFAAASLCGLANGGKKHVISLSPLKKYIRNNNNIYLNDNNSLDNNNNNLCVIDNNYIASSTVVASASIYQPASKQFVSHHQQQSVKSLSSRLASQLSSYMRSAEHSVHKQPKLNSASAILISLSIVTLSFLPASNLFVYVGFVVAERILYLPSVGYCLLIGLGLGKLISFKVQRKAVKARQRMDELRHRNTRSMATILFLIILISACSLKTIRRNGDWRDEESLFRSAIKVNPPKGNFSQYPLCFSLFSSVLAVHRARWNRTMRTVFTVAIYLLCKIFVYCLVELLLISEICLCGSILSTLSSSSFSEAA